MLQTQIDAIDHNIINTVNVDYCLNDENLSKSISDLSLPLEIRIQALDLFFVKQGADNTIEIINKLRMMYELSGIKNLRSFLYEICSKSSIGPFLKSISAEALCSHNDKLGYQALNNILPFLGDDIGTPYKIELIKTLMKSEEYKEPASNYFCNIINNMMLDCDYRYKTILSLENNYFLEQACTVFINNDKNNIRYRILSGQILLKLNTNNKIIENILLDFAKNDQNDYNARADATDVLLQLGSEDIKKIARQIIMELGKTKGTGIYNNAQNVHVKDIEDSVKQALEFLQGFEIMQYRGKVISTDFVEKKIFNIIREEKLDTDLDKIKVSLNRINMDRALYSKYNCTLSLILLKVWTYMSDHKHENDMKKRLIEELVEMAETCSSGFVTRLVNSMSGFGDFSMKISWRDQIVSNFSGRLNARIRDIDNLTFQEKVLNEMTIESCKYEDRKNFLKFFRKNILDIRGELYDEFKEYINDSDFDLYFRAALSVYENGSFV